MEQLLNSLKEGQSGRMTSVTADSDLKQRLLDFGMMEGTKIRCLRKGPSGSPILYRVRGTMLALRNEDAAGIVVISCPL